jgi:hypothetical protein
VILAVAQNGTSGLLAERKHARRLAVLATPRTGVMGPCHPLVGYAVGRQRYWSALSNADSSERVTGSLASKIRPASESRVSASGWVGLTCTCTQG